MATLIEKQRIHARLSRDANNASSDLLPSPMPAAIQDAVHQLHLERHVTTSTEGLSDITFESDDGLGSDRTTTACKTSSSGAILLAHLIPLCL